MNSACSIAPILGQAPRRKAVQNEDLAAPLRDPVYGKVQPPKLATSRIGVHALIVEPSPSQRAGEAAFVRRPRR